MNDEPNLSPGAPLRPALVWAWSPDLPHAETGPVEARLAHLMACGSEAVLLEARRPGADPFLRVRQAASERGLPVVEALGSRAVRLEWPLTDWQIVDLAHALVERTDLDTIVCSGPEHDAAAMLAAARHLRRRLDRLAWERFQ